MHLIFAKMNNRPKYVDATGAFLPESNALYQLMVGRNYDARYQTINTENFSSRVAMTDHILFQIRKHKEIRSISLFCHGWRTGVQFFPRGKRGAALIAAEMAQRKVKMLNLFACSAAAPHPQGNFAQWVHFSCEELGHRAQIMGHETAGHTTSNPNIHFYWPGGEISTSTIRDGFRDHMKKQQEYRLWLPFDHYRS